ncbi:hypothetical protein [Alteromonas ponticola]|uniref:MafI family immunity protein n=1 Tax=Alteromonas ponticola TaxID=2720613 RepID=A0ABX1R8J0_9ALTE|nr:hypothetical protein [Alteromonas ponticola]NMH61543.1 hypothetical protein [Alteromonas ponticola]
MNDNSEIELIDIFKIIESELQANDKWLPLNRREDIIHYLHHGEPSMAFEYLYLEIFERKNATITANLEDVMKIAKYFSLDKEEECMIDHEFMKKLNNLISRTIEKH